jgi:anti-sigma factor RsiW
MNCRGAFRRLSAYIDNALSPGIRRAVDEHLKGCPSCRKKLAEFQAISNTAGDLPPLEVSEGFADRVLIAVKKQQKTREVVGSNRYKLAFASAAFTVAAIAVFFVFGTGPNDLTVAQSSEILQEALGTPDPPEMNEYSEMKKLKVWNVPPEIRESAR